MKQNQGKKQISEVKQKVRKFKEGGSEIDLFCK